MSTCLKRQIDAYFKALDGSHKRLGAFVGPRSKLQRFGTASSGTDISDLVIESVRSVASRHSGAWSEYVHTFSAENAEMVRGFLRHQ